jgi:hypothetical protein
MHLALTEESNNLEPHDKTKQDWKGVIDIGVTDFPLTFLASRYSEFPTAPYRDY